jgi:hypothetical protein
VCECACVCAAAAATTATAAVVAHIATLMGYVAPLVAHVAALMSHVATLVAHVASLALPCSAWFGPETLLRNRPSKEPQLPTLKMHDSRCSKLQNQVLVVTWGTPKNPENFAFFVQKLGPKPGPGRGSAFGPLLRKMISKGPGLGSLSGP